MSWIDLDHVPLLENASTFPAWKRHIAQVLKDEGFWGHVEGTDNAWDMWPKTPEPEKPTSASSAEDIARYQWWWREDVRARGVMLRRVSQVVYDNLQIADGVSARVVWGRLAARYERGISTALEVVFGESTFGSTY